MTISVAELVKTRELVAGLLDELGLEAYLFDVEPGTAQWALQIECATDTGWQRLTLPLDRDTLLQCERDEGLRQHLLSHWAGRLAACCTN